MGGGFNLFWWLGFSCLPTVKLKDKIIFHICTLSSLLAFSPFPFLLLLFVTSIVIWYSTCSNVFPLHLGRTCLKFWLEANYLHWVFLSVFVRLWVWLKRSQVSFIIHPFQLTTYIDLSGGSQDCVIIHLSNSLHICWPLICQQCITSFVHPALLNNVWIWWVLSSSTWCFVVWFIFTIILDKPAASSFYPEDWGRRFLWNIG